MSDTVAGISIDLCSIFIVTIIIYAVMREGEEAKKESRNFIFCLLFLLLYFALSLHVWMTGDGQMSMLLIKLLSTLAYVSCMASIVFFTYYLVDNMNRKTYVSYELA